MTTLEKFLRKERVYTKFIKNIKHRYAYIYFEANGERPNSIKNAFSWCSTAEGLDFCSELHYKFQEYLKQKS